MDGREKINKLSSQEVEEIQHKLKIGEYDGKERRYRHQDNFKRKGFLAVSMLLRIADPNKTLTGLKYDLSFYSGSSGIIDKLIISFDWNEEVWDHISNELSLTSPEKILNGPWADDFQSLLTEDESADFNLEQLLADHLNHDFTKKEFQSAFDPLKDRVLFHTESGPNYWMVCWANETTINYCQHDTG